MQKFFIENYVWPDSYSLKDDPQAGNIILNFLHDRLAELQQYDEMRRAWVKDNLPADYEMTYFFHPHAQNVAADMEKTAGYMGLPENAVDNLFLVMLGHDMGKTKLPPHLWDMVEKPEDNIKEARRKHTEIGAAMIDESLKLDHPFVDLLKDVVLNHHEQMDGNGFRGLKGEDLSAPVRLACIIESFDGYQTPRPHFGDRDISTEGVLKRMREEKGASLYDMDLFEAFAKTKLNDYNKQEAIQEE